MKVREIIADLSEENLNLPVRFTTGPDELTIVSIYEGKDSAGRKVLWVDLEEPIDDAEDLK